MSSEAHLRKTLGPVSLWGLGVGYVISGEYFGWNLGLPEGGTYGMLIATAIITAMYVTFVLSYTELACALPRAGGAFVYCSRAFGPYVGSLAGIVQCVEFVFAPPAIAMAIGAYVQQRFPTLAPTYAAMVAYLLFTSLNAWGVKQAAIFEVFVTVLAVIELVIFMAVVAPHFQLEKFQSEALPNGVGGIVASLPFAIWFYLAIEGVANVAEETVDPRRSVVIGFTSAIATLVVLALGVFFLSTGVAGWRAIVFAPGSTDPSDAPLPLALRQVVDANSALYTMLLGIGLLGLIASFHGIILVAARATMELGRSGFAPAWLGDIQQQTKTPVNALIANLILGIIAILSGKTAEIITLSVFGAVALYILTMLALFALRRSEPDLPRPYRAIGYPYFAAIALLIACGAFVSLWWIYPLIGGVFAVFLFLGTLYFRFAPRQRLTLDLEIS